ncbi:MAG: hypothetical protein WA071_26725 [Undibacterium umbellatum]
MRITRPITLLSGIALLMFGGLAYAQKAGNALGLGNTSEKINLELDTSKQVAEMFKKFKQYNDTNRMQIYDSSKPPVYTIPIKIDLTAKEQSDESKACTAPKIFFNTNSKRCMSKSEVAEYKE